MFELDVSDTSRPGPARPSLRRRAWVASLGVHVVAVGIMAQSVKTWTPRDPFVAGSRTATAVSLAAEFSPSPERWDDVGEPAAITIEPERALIREIEFVQVSSTTLDVPEVELLAEGLEVDESAEPSVPPLDRPVPGPVEEVAGETAAESPSETPASGAAAELPRASAESNRGEAAVSSAAETIGTVEDPALPIAIFNPPPFYPAGAVQARQEGLTVLRVTIAPDGRVTQVSVERSSGYAVLDGAAVGAVSRWRFDWGEGARTTRDWTGRLTVRFQLR